MTKEKTGYTKQQILASEKFAGRIDLLRALLRDDETYSIARVEKLIKEYDESSPGGFAATPFKTKGATGADKMRG